MVDGAPIEIGEKLARNSSLCVKFGMNKLLLDFVCSNIGLLLHAE